MQGGQTRTFTYSSLSRLTSAVNPESGTTSYTYDNNGNLLTKTDGRGVVKTFDPYDALNRVKRWTYTGGQPEARSTSEVTLSYDSCGNNSKGRLCSVTSKDSAGAVFSTTSYSGYDGFGRAGQTSQMTNVAPYGQPPSYQTYTMSYNYNLAGHLTSQTYPSGLMVKTSYDGAGRIAGVSNSDGSLYYVGAVETDPVNSMQYAAHGGLQQMKVANGLWEETRYNARLQPLQIGLGRTQTALGSSLTQTNSDYLLLDYTYSSTQNNGNLLNQRIRVAAAGTAPALDLTQTYAYDTVNRLHTASETAGGGTAWSAITYDFDRFGNRAVTAGYKPVPGQTPIALTEFSTSTNRMVAPSVYDGVGNQTTDKGGCTTKYDGENKLVEFNCGLGITTYGYDGHSRRVQKVSGGLTTIYVYNVSGQLIAEYTSQGPTGTGISYLTADHLGSTRVVTDANRSVKARRDYLPFGEEIEVAYGGRSSIPGYGVTEGTRQRFTGKERDIESARDYFGARYYSEAQGRFTSVDPVGLGGTLFQPQLLNRYAYVHNRPFKYVDPDGRWATLPYYLSFLRGHLDIYRSALPGLSKRQMDIVIETNKIVDYCEGCQSPQASFTHGMYDARNNQSPLDAASFSAAYRDQLLSAAKDAQAAHEAQGYDDIDDIALMYFIGAMHYVTDADSLFHADNTVSQNPKGWTGNWLKGFGHFVGEFFSAYVGPGVGQYTLAIWDVQAYFHTVFGERLAQKTLKRQKRPHVEVTVQYRLDEVFD